MTPHPLVVQLRFARSEFRRALEGLGEGENMAIRQSLGHTGLPDFVGNIDDEAPYQPH